MSVLLTQWQSVALRGSKTEGFLPLLLYYCLLLLILFLGQKDSSVTVSSILVVNKGSHFKVGLHLAMPSKTRQVQDDFELTQTTL